MRISDWSSDVCSSDLLTVVRRRAALALDHDRDALLAATALEHGLTFVTYRAAAFRGTRVKLLDPSRLSADAGDDGDWREATRGRSPWIQIGRAWCRESV